MTNKENLNNLKAILEALENHVLEEQKKPFWTDGYMCWDISEERHDYRVQKEVLLLKIEIEELKIKLKEKEQD